MLISILHTFAVFGRTTLRLFVISLAASGLTDTSSASDTVITAIWTLAPLWPLWPDSAATNRDVCTPPRYTHSTSVHSRTSVGQCFRSGLRTSCRLFANCHLWHRVGPRGSAVERQSLASALSPSCARPAADGWPLMWVSRPLYLSSALLFPPCFS